MSAKFDMLDPDSARVDGRETTCRTMQSLDIRIRGIRPSVQHSARARREAHGDRIDAAVNVVPPHSKRVRTRNAARAGAAAVGERAALVGNARRRAPASALRRATASRASSALASTGESAEGIKPVPHSSRAGAVGKNKVCPIARLRLRRAERRSERMIDGE